MKRVILLILMIAGAYAGRRTNVSDLRNADIVLSQGGTMAWARHITGQDVNDLTSWDEFESVCVIPGNGTKLNGDGWTEDEVWVIVKRTVNGSTVRYVEQFQPLDWGSDDDYCYFVDCGLQGNSSGVAETGGSSPTATTYTMMVFADTSNVWGVPLGDVAMLGTPSGDANDIGGGLVGIPYTGHPFDVNDTVVISGTTNYNGTFALDSSTSTNELVITDTYAAENFDAGNARVCRFIQNLPIGSGRVAVDSSGTIYYGGPRTPNGDLGTGYYHVTKIETDGTITKGVFANGWGAAGYNSWGTVDLETFSATDGNDYLYIYNIVTGPTDYGYMYKIDLGDGSLKWRTEVADRAGNPNNDIDVDDDGNVYAVGNGDVIQWDADDGSQTVIGTDTGTYALLVNSTLDLIVCGGSGSLPNTLYAYTLDGTGTDSEQIGTGFIVRGSLACDDEFLFVMGYESGTTKIWKYSWDGTDLVEVGEVDTGISTADGIFIDPFDNIVVVEVDNTVFPNYYSKALVSLGTIDYFKSNMLTGWNNAVGGNWTGGSSVPNGASTGGSDPDYGVDVNEIEIAHLESATVCVYADGIPLGTYGVVQDVNGTWVADLEDDYSVVIAGINYYSIYETFPLERDQRLQQIKTRKASITGVRLDFYETMGCHIGVDLTNSTDLQFSDDDFATAMDAWTGAKIITFPRGVSREPILYLWEWDPIPMKLRGMYSTLNVVVPEER